MKLREGQCASSAFDHADGRLPLIKHRVHHRLHLLSGADAHRRVHRDAHQPKGLSVVLKGTWSDLTTLESSSIVLMQANHTPNGLRDADIIHGPHEQHCFQTRHVDTLAQDAVMENHELLVVVLAPGTQSVEEHLTVDLTTINHGTSLGSDVHPRETTILQLLAEVSLRNQRNNLLGCLRADQNLAHLLSIDGLNQILTVNIGNDLTLREHLKLLHHNLRRNDETTVHKFRSRNVANHLTIHCTIIHTRFCNSSRMLRSSSEEIAAVSSRSVMLGGREEMALNRIVCLIKVDGIDLNICLLQALQGVVGGENQFMTRSLIHPVTDLSRASRALVMGFTTMHVQHRGIGDKLQKLARQLLCQEDAGCRHNNGLRSLFEKLTNRIKDRNVGLAAASGDNHLTFQVLGKGIQSTLLVGAKLEHHQASQYRYYTAKNKGTEAPLCH